MDKDEALRMALKSLEFYYDLWKEKVDAQTITAIREALVQPEQEPVAWQVMVENESLKEFPIKDMAHDWCVHQKLSGFYHAYWIRPLYTTPPQRPWVGLTEEEIDIWNIVAPSRLRDFVRCIEAKLRKKNGC